MGAVGAVGGVARFNVGVMDGEGSSRDERVAAGIVRKAKLQLSVADQVGWSRLNLG